MADALIPNLAPGGDGEAGVNELLGQLKEAYMFATETNVKTTKVKTVEGAKETVAQQRPNIG